MGGEFVTLILKKKYIDIPVGDDMYVEFNEYILNGGFPKTCFDLESKQAVKREQKYYLVSQDYQVSVGRIGKLECDFIVKDKNQ